MISYTKSHEEYTYIPTRLNRTDKLELEPGRRTQDKYTKTSYTSTPWKRAIKKGKNFYKSMKDNKVLRNQTSPLR